MTERPTLASLAADLAAGRVTARRLVEDCLARIDDPAGEGARVFVHVDRDNALAAADAMDALRWANAAPSPYAGIPISIKDLFDIKGQITKAGSRVLDDRDPEQSDAPVVARLRRAGFVLIGRTNMSEFAYSGLGLNPHYGTPKGAWDRAANGGTGHVPGGSSSGAAVSVADGMAHAALGTDTGGSCRIPAAFNGLVGYKPTQSRIPLEGGFPLSFTLDSYGPLANSVNCCAIMDAVLANETVRPLTSRPVKGLRLAVPTTIVLDDCDEAVTTAFERALGKLADAGAVIERIAVPQFEKIIELNAKGGFAAAESFAWHRRLLAHRGDNYDPRVATRIRRGESQSAADYIDLVGARRALILRLADLVAPYDAMAMPTVACTPPAIAGITDDAAYNIANLRSLRNCTFINVVDGCAISLPIHRDGEVPVGLMLAASNGQDRKLFEIAAGVEQAMVASRHQPV